MVHRTTEVASAANGQLAGEVASAVASKPAGTAKRVRLSREKDAYLPLDTVKVDRATMWGNPYRVGEPVDMNQARRWGWSISPEGRKVVCADATEAVARFRHCLHWDEAIHDHVRKKLRGKNLACWCPLDQPCHADVLMEIANSDPAVIRAAHDAVDECIIKSTREVLTDGK